MTMAMGNWIREYAPLAWLLLVISGHAQTNGITTRPLAKAEPGSSNYPSLEEWQALNTSISGRLVKFSNPGALCYGPTFDEAGCKTYQKQIQNATFIGDTPGLTNWPQWAGNPCPPTVVSRGSLQPGPAEECTTGKYPSYIVAAKSAEDIATAMKWASKMGVRVSVKNTGHDFLGRNVGGLSIWTRHLKGVEFLEQWNGTTNRPDVSGKWKGAAAVYGSGNIWNVVNGEMTKRKHIVVAGVEGTVGAGGGWIQGGGHGPYSNQYGFGAEQVLEFEVVTPTGDIVTASETSHPDLFYALRGGGASTYGIVTKITYKAYPMPPASILAFNIAPMNNRPESQEAYYNAIGYLFSQMPTLNDCGLSGYPVLKRESYIGALMAPSKSVEEVNACWDPMATKMRSLGASVLSYPISDSLSTTASAMLGGSSGASSMVSELSGYPFVMGSRLLSRKALSDPANLANITAAIRTILDDPNMYILTYPNIPGEKHQAREWDIGLNPAWKTSSLHVIAMWNDGLPGGIGKLPFQTKMVLPENVQDKLVLPQHEKRSLGKSQGFNEIAWAPKEKIRAVEERMMNKYVPLFDALSENHGAYINEASPYEKDWKTTFYGGGERYEKLLKIKQKYDPNNVLWCFPCVGGDVFSEGKDGKLYVNEDSKVRS
ncbi:FAD binding domain-containing protein [Venturia nashicola]|nr:FAD binding domain-containing protein [Venturia nashicola]